VFGHVTHLAVPAVNQPPVEVRGVGVEPEVADAEGVEPARPGESQQLVLELGQCV
jgi:hypothetical protein